MAGGSERLLEIEESAELAEYRSFVPPDPGDQVGAGTALAWAFLLLFVGGALTVAAFFLLVPCALLVALGVLLGIVSVARKALAGRGYRDAELQHVALRIVEGRTALGSGAATRHVTVELADGERGELVVSDAVEAELSPGSVGMGCLRERYLLDFRPAGP